MIDRNPDLCSLTYIEVRGLSTFLKIYVQLLVTVLWLVVVGRVLISWINPRFEGPVARFLFETTEPIISPIRRLMPATGMIDFSPLIVLFVLGFIVRLVVLG